MIQVARLLPAIFACALVPAASLPQRYALVLADAPVARQVLGGGFASRSALSGRIADTQRRALLRAQQRLKSALRERKIPVAGSVDTLANAVFVTVSPDCAAELKAIPGVAAVIPMQTVHRKLNKALDLVNANAAWEALGGAGNAGTGVKIAILDTGIDETHPGFQDPALTPPAGFPKYGNADDAAHTSGKVIAARSFVSYLAIGDGTPELTRPDDLSVRDRIGHGTAVAMIAAGVSHQGPIGTISGVAPKAWLGNYKIFGSPGVNDSTTADVVLQALEAAFNDGMDIALLSAGDLPAMWGPGDQGATCGQPEGTPCDPLIGAVSAAASGGMTVVLPSGNDGDLGANTINTPGDFAAAITVGATTNAHLVTATVSTPGESLSARLGDGPQLMAALSAPLLPASSIAATELGCVPYPAGSFNGGIALISAGQCSFATKVLNAQVAGAKAVLIFSQAGDPTLVAPSGLSNTGIPAALISATSAASLKNDWSAHGGVLVTLNPTPVETTPATADLVASFSSRGPNIGDSGIKPDLAAPGAAIYTAGQNYDPNGDLYSANRYVGVDGTSFAAALAAGAAALVKQAHPGYSTGQIKSALANTASSAVMDFDVNGNPITARSVAVGGGKLNAGSALASTLTVVPATVSFGALRGALPTRSVVITNTGATGATVQLAIAQRDPDSKASVSVTPSTLSLAPGASASVTIALTGSIPSPGSYEGAVTVDGGAVPLRIPYLYLVGDGKPFSLIPLVGRNFVTESGTAVNLAFRIVDRYGVPVNNMQVRFAPATSVYAATPATDQLGIAEAYMTTGASGDPTFSADLLNNAGTIRFDGRLRARPQISNNGVVDAASFQAPKGFAPGSYVTIFGSGLSESFEMAHTRSLPLALAGVSVSFDAPASNIHVPGRLHFASDRQINVQIPWELAGIGTAVMKVTLSNSSSKNVRPDNSSLGTFQSQTFTIPIADYSPAFFEYSDNGQTLALAEDEQYALISSENPVERGHVIQFFVNGLGPVAPGTQPASGEPAPGVAPLAATTTLPSVTIGGQPAAVTFSGLAPFLVGLYQVNTVTPETISPGLQPVVLSIGAVTAKSTLVPVR